MQNRSATEHPNQTQARSLLAEIEGSPEIVIPRRETLVKWLKALLVSWNRRGYVMEPEEPADLAALDGFLRSLDVPRLAGQVA